MNETGHPFDEFAGGTLDAHHGDGTENFTAENPDVLTFSIHELGIFPGSGNDDVASKGIFNSPLTIETGIGDEALLREAIRFIGLAKEMEVDIIFIAAGADGHSEDPLTHLRYSIAGYEKVAQLVRGRFPDAPILIGGAGECHGPGPMWRIELVRRRFKNLR